MEYLVEGQPCSNLPLYVLLPIDGEGHSHTLIETTCCPSAASWSRENVQILCGGKMDPVMSKLWYPIRVVHCQSTAQPKVNQKAYLIHYQNCMNCLTQRWPGCLAQTLQTMGSRMTVMYPFYQGKAQDWLRTSSHGDSTILHCSKITSFPVPLIFGLASASAFTSFHVCTSSSLGIQCKITLCEPWQICPTQISPDIDGDTIHVDSMVDFSMGVDLKIFGLSAVTPTRETNKTTLLIGPVGVWAVWTWRQYTW